MNNVDLVFKNKYNFDTHEFEDINYSLNFKEYVSLMNLLLK